MHTNFTQNNQKDDFNQLRGYALGTTYSISYSSSKLSKNLLSQKIDRENKLTLLALEHERRSAKAAQMVSKILKNFPNDELVKSAYQNLTNEFKGSLEYNASHILVKEESQAKTIRKDISIGKNFEALAKEHSIGPTGKNGGNLNWFDLASMVPEFSTALMVLSEGDVSQPVQTKFGWHLKKLNETREKKIPEFKKIESEKSSPVIKSFFEKAKKFWKKT